MNIWPVKPGRSSGSTSLAAGGFGKRSIFRRESAMLIAQFVKVDYLKEGADDCPLVCLYDFDKEDAQRLRQIFESLADGLIERVPIDGVESVDGTKSTFVRSAEDRGVIKTGLRHFDVALAPDGWRKAVDYTEPFCDGGFGYQWLAPQTRGIQLLLSKDGAW